MNLLKKVNEVAYTKWDNRIIKIYSSEDKFYCDCFLSLNPYLDNLDFDWDWGCTNLSPDLLLTVLNVVAELEVTPVEERFLEKEYTVQVFPVDDGYLNLDDDGCVYTDDFDQISGTRTQFTQSEIEKFKQRDDIAIDWNKAKIEEVKEDE